MAKYQQYDEYKDIQNEWVSSVPSDWKVVPLKALCLNPVKDGPHETPIFIDEGVPFLSVDGIQNNQLVFEGCRYISAQDHEKYSRKCAPAKGDVLLGKAASVGKVAYVETEMDFNVWSPLAVITPKADKLGKYIFYAFQSTVLQAQCDVYSNANTQKNLGMNTIDNLHLPFPSYEEAEVIANFLDHETAQIDTLIDKQQTLIQLLKEKRQAVISHAVTKGLNPNAPMKDSGVEWLGEVPEHWDVATVRRIISRMEQGKSPQCESSPAKLDEWGVLKTSCVNGGRFHEEENKLLPSHIDPHEEYEVQAGDLLMSRASGSINLIGSVVLVQDNVRAKLLLSDKVFRIYLNKDYDSLFFAYLMSSSYMRSSIEIAISGAEGMANNIAKSAIMEFIIPILPIEEQVEIASYIKAIESKYSSLISKAEQAIQLMQERRTALISAAVTGKIDVRGWRASDSK